MGQVNKVSKDVWASEKTKDGCWTPGLHPLVAVEVLYCTRTYVRQASEASG